MLVLLENLFYEKMSVLKDLQRMSLKIEDLNSNSNTVFRDQDSPDNLGMLLKENEEHSSFVR